MKLELVSYALCPFVHRTTTLLHEKGASFDIRYVDLKNKPDWFLAMSPRGKVPLLVADGEVLFESAIINEFLDETHPPRLLPDDPRARARQRAWVEVSSDLIAALWKMLQSPNADDVDPGRAACDAILARLEGEIRGDFFAGDAFGLVDAAFAPSLYRLLLVERVKGVRFFARWPKVDAWARRVAARPSVKAGIPADFDDRYAAGLRPGGWLDAAQA